MLIGAFTKPSVGLARQSNILIWDPATKMEHLVRSSAFASSTRSFDIVIPTPALPTVTAVNYRSFRSLFDLLHGKRETARPGQGPEAISPAHGISASGRPEVQVSQLARVGNLMATTIKASDVLALSKWLEKNGYKPNAAQNKWLEKYVQKRWYLTAFKVATEEEMFETDAVRLSFKTDVPIDPYYTPNRSWLRGIRQELYVISPNQMAGFVGAKTPWKTNVESHAFMTRSATESLARDLKLKPSDIPGKSWVHRYLENSADTNATDDLFFYPLPAHSAVASSNKKSKLGKSSNFSSRL